MRKGSVAAAALIGIGLTVFLEQVTSIDGPGLLFLALGAAFFLVYFSQPRPSQLVVPAGILSGLGLGVTLGAARLGPDFLHPAFLAGGLALGFGAIYLLGDQVRHRWALWPAAALAVIAWWSFVSSAPWLKDTFGALAHNFWPLLLVGAGLWLIERNRCDRPNRV